MSTIEAPVVGRDSDLQTEDGPVAHIVKTKPGENAAAIVLKARIFGNTLEALCGHRFVPSRNPENLPMCQACKEIYDLYRIENEGLNEGPTV